VYLATRPADKHAVGDTGATMYCTGVNKIGEEGRKRTGRKRMKPQKKED
jgi:hypothetical protein